LSRITRSNVTGLAHETSFEQSAMAVALHAQGQWAAARELYEQAFDVAHELGTPFEMGTAAVAA
jgi:hypothetical protein